MKSPITGEEMILKKEMREMTYRKETFQVMYHYYRCANSGEQFTDERLDELNLTQVYNQYRELTGVPFPEEIRAIREQYGLSAAKMSEVLGFGANVYRNYEAGEVPSVSNGRMIRLIRDPEEFVKLIGYSSNLFTPEEQARIHKKVAHALAAQDPEQNMIETRLLGERKPGIWNGYRVAVLDKICHMIAFFAGNQQPYKTKLNKLMFYADFSFFRDYGSSISGAQYQALPKGPVPRHYDYLYAYAVEHGYVDVRETYFNDHVGEQFVTGQRQFDASLFTEEELKALGRVAAFFKRKSVSEVVEISHREAAWAENEEGFGRINYGYGFHLQYP